jgi:adenylosuccinate lyase
VAVPDYYGRRLRVLQGQIGRCGELPKIPGKLSGPVGSFATKAVHPTIEWELLRSMGLTCDCDDPSHRPPASQIVPRDYLSRWAWAVADLVSAYAALAMDIRLMSHSGVREVREGRGPGYTGSSAMPHKRNPNRCERMTGLARMARTAALAIAEGIEQWHERDLAHSSVEREFVPLLAGLGHYSGLLMNEVLTTLEVDAEQMWANLQANYTDAFTHERMVDLQLDGIPYHKAAKAAVLTEEGN